MNKENPATSLGWMAIGTGVAIVGVTLMFGDAIKKKLESIIKTNWFF